jgi:hypothetical protein
MSKTLLMTIAAGAVTFFLGQVLYNKFGSKFV